MRRRVGKLSFAAYVMAACQELHDWSGNAACRPAACAGLLPQPDIPVAATGIVYNVQTIGAQQADTCTALDGACSSYTSPTCVHVSNADASSARPPVAVFMLSLGLSFALCARVGHHLGAAQPHSAKLAGELL